MNYKNTLENIFQIVKSQENSGQLADYIPELSKVDPEKFGVGFLAKNEEVIGIGDCDTKFSIQSISKVLALSLAYGLIGEKIWERVGIEPSGNPFNSLMQLETDLGKPRNPFINAGALVICDMLLSNLKDPQNDFLDYVRQFSSIQDLNFTRAIAESEKKTGFRNRALCNFIKSLGNIENKPEDVLNFYFNMSSIEMTCKQLAKTFSLFASCNYRTSEGNQMLDLIHIKRINAIMQTCGFYDESGEFAFKVGLPGKSGVGGGIVAVHPELYSIAVWSPKLNEKGNSYRGMKLLEMFTTKTKLSIF